MDEQYTLDVKRRPIMPGDVLKVFHFIGARGKRHYMYQQALEYYSLPTWDGYRRLKISHLNRMGDEPLTRDHWYCVEAENVRLHGYEIVQSVNCDHENRSALGADASTEGGVDV